MDPLWPGLAVSAVLLLALSVARAVKIVFAEMPEAEGRDLSIERRHMPAGARVETFTFRGDADALPAACRGADAILTDYVPSTAPCSAGSRAAESSRSRRPAGIAWTSPPPRSAASASPRVGEYCTDEVADHTLALLLALERRLLDYHRQVQVGHSWRWNEVQGIERLAGQTLGLVGFGRIGQAVCRRALGFGLEVLACDPRVDAEDRPRPRRRAVRASTDVLARADILSLHSNLDAGSRGLLDRAAFAKMRRRPLLINVARGGLVVEADLVAALDAGLMRGAALDVLAEDSPDLGHHPLVGRRDVLLTPHVAFYSESALEDLRRISAANIRAFLDGRPERRIPARRARGRQSMSATGSFDGAPERGTINFSVGQPSADLLPLKLLASGGERFFADAAPFDLNYGQRQGDARFRAALAAFLGEAPGRPVDPDSLMLTGGISQGLDFVCGRLAKAGDVVFVEEPSYPYSFQIFRDHGLEIVGVPVDAAGMDVAQLERLLAQHRPKLVYTIPPSTTRPAACSTARAATGSSRSRASTASRSWPTRCTSSCTTARRRRPRSAPWAWPATCSRSAPSRKFSRRACASAGSRRRPH